MVAEYSVSRGDCFYDETKKETIKMTSDDRVQNVVPGLKGPETP